MFFGEIFLRILVLLFSANKTCSLNHKEEEKAWFLVFFPRDEKFRDPG
jgi:hypothetical protein